MLSLGDLPLLNACLNGTSAALLLAGYWMVRTGRTRAHARCMVAALAVSSLFLASYVAYHVGMKMEHGEAHTTFREPAWFRPFYLAVLFSHLALAMAVVPMVLATVHRAARKRWEAHRRLARWTWPVWMYVSVTGVGIYLVLYQIFPQR